MSDGCIGAAHGDMQLLTETRWSLTFSSLSLSRVAAECGANKLYQSSATHRLLSPGGSCVTQTKRRLILIIQPKNAVPHSLRRRLHRPDTILCPNDRRGAFVNIRLMTLVLQNTLNLCLKKQSKQQVTADVNNKTTL